MYLSLLSETGDIAIEFSLLVAIIVVTVLLGIAAIVAFVFRIMIFFSYWVSNRTRSSGGYTGETAARKMLRELGYNDVDVQKCGFFRALIYGNHYNPKRKIIYLRASTFKGDNLTSVGLALQKVGLVIQDKKGGSVKSRWRLQQLGIFGPILFIPIVLVGVIVDAVMLVKTGGTFSGVGTLVAACIGIAFFIVSFVLTIYTMVVENRANKEALEILKYNDFLNAEEQAQVAKVFRTYMLSYITDFIISLLQIIRFILKIALAAMQSKKN